VFVFVRHKGPTILSGHKFLQTTTVPGSCCQCVL